MRIQTRIATIDDLEEILHINRKWQGDVVGTDPRKGFLSLTFEKEELKKIIQNSEIVVGIDLENRVVGYCSVNNFSDVIPKFSGKKVEELKSRAIINPSLNIALGAQILLETKYRGQTNRETLLRFLIKTIRTKYDLMWTSVAKNNPIILRINKIDGWKIVDEDEERYYLTLELHNEQLPINKNQLG